jgi:hypothetical protein
MIRSIRTRLETALVDSHMFVIRVASRSVLPVNRVTNVSAAACLLEYTLTITSLRLRASTFGFQMTR